MPSDLTRNPALRDEATAPSCGSVIGRRDALARLGLSVVAVYSAPTVLHLEREASATRIQPSRCHAKGKANGNPWCRDRGGWRDRDRDHDDRDRWRSSRRDDDGRPRFRGSGRPRRDD